MENEIGIYNSVRAEWSERGARERWGEEWGREETRKGKEMEDLRDGGGRADQVNVIW